MNLPNSITVVRILSVPLIVWLILREEMLIAFVFFMMSGLSDALDGLIAKRFNLVTRLGKYLDPLADKILLVSIYVTLGVIGEIPNWLVFLVVSRDVIIIGGVFYSYFLGIRLHINPVRISKVNTFFQIALAALIIGAAGFELDLGVWRSVMVYIVCLTTIFSGFSYIRNWVSYSQQSD